MSKQDKPKAGSLLAWTSGEYSSYYVHGIFVVLREFDLQAEIAEHLKAHPEQTQEGYFEQDMVLTRLIAQGYLLEIEHGTIHGDGCYGGPDSMSYTPPR